jgi:hypothetical protein
VRTPESNRHIEWKKEEGYAVECDKINTTPMNACLFVWPTQTLAEEAKALAVMGRVEER